MLTRGIVAANWLFQVYQITYDMSLNRLESFLNQWCVVCIYLAQTTILKQITNQTLSMEAQHLRINQELLNTHRFIQDWHELTWINPNYFDVHPALAGFWFIAIWQGTVFHQSAVALWPVRCQHCCRPAMQPAPTATCNRSKP